MNVANVVKQVSMLADRVVAPPIGITVLIYHRVGGGSDSLVDLDTDTFEAQLTHLSEHHRVLSIDEAVDELTAVDDPSHTPRAGVVITFDDGTDDFCEHAAPALERHGLPATLYVATEFVDTGSDFPWGAPPTTWAALREATRSGRITVGSHTHSHWLLDRLDPSEVAADLDTSIRLIEDNLGSTPEHFAYPKAVGGSVKADIEIRRRFRSAALAASRVNRPGPTTDVLRLWRTPVQRTDDATVFAAKAAGGLRLEGELRSLVARARYRGART